MRLIVSSFLYIIFVALLELYLKTNHETVTVTWIIFVNQKCGYKMFFFKMAAVQISLGLHVLRNFTILSFWMFCGYCSFGLVIFNFDLLTIILTNNSFHKLERSHHSHMIPLRQTDGQTDRHCVLCDNTMTKFQTADTEYERNDAGESHIKQSDNNVSTWSLRSLDRSQSRNTDCTA